jgi:hypothetical protein
MNKLAITTLASSLLLLTGSIADAQSARARIADTPIRGEANLGSAIIATLKEGDLVDVVDLQGDWYRVVVPGEPDRPRVGYVLANLIEFEPTDGSSPSIPPLTSRAAPLSAQSSPIAQGPPIAPTLAQVTLQREQTTAREQALKVEIDALLAEVLALQNDQPGRSLPSGQIRRPVSQQLQPREGMWFNGGLGLGSLGCEGCVGRWTGASPGLSLGTTITDRLLLGVGTSSYYTSFDDGSTLSAGTLDGRLNFYPVRSSGFFVTGGMGLGVVRSGEVGSIGETHTGVAVVLGLGWDIRVRPNLSLTPFLNGFGINTPGLNTGVRQAGLGITVH